MKCGRASSLNQEASQSSGRQNILSRTGGGEVAEAWAWAWCGSDPRAFLISCIWGGSERNSSELLAWAFKW